MEDLRTTREEAEKLLLHLKQAMSDKYCPQRQGGCITSACMSYRAGKVHDDLEVQKTKQEDKETLGHFIVTPPRCVNRNVNGDI